MRKPRRFLAQSSSKESQFEKPYIADEYTLMHLDWDDPGFDDIDDIILPPDIPDTPIDPDPDIPVIPDVPPWIPVPPIEPFPPLDPIDPLPDPPFPPDTPVPPFPPAPVPPDLPNFPPYDPPDDPYVPPDPYDPQDPIVPPDVPDIPPPFPPITPPDVPPNFPPYTPDDEPPDFPPYVPPETPDTPPWARWCFRPHTFSINEPENGPNFKPPGASDEDYEIPITINGGAPSVIKWWIRNSGTNNWDVNGRNNAETRSYNYLPTNSAHKVYITVASIYNPPVAEDYEDCATLYVEECDFGPVSTRSIEICPCNCDDEDALAWDTENNPTTMDRSETIDIYVTGGCPPYTWTYETDDMSDFSLGSGTTEDGNNTLTSASNATGTCFINVTDQCGAEVADGIMCTVGSWTQQYWGYVGNVGAGIKNCTCGDADCGGYSGCTLGCLERCLLISGTGYQVSYENIEFSGEPTGYYEHSTGIKFSNIQSVCQNGEGECLVGAYPGYCETESWETTPNMAMYNVNVDNWNSYEHLSRALPFVISTASSQEFTPHLVWWSAIGMEGHYMAEFNYSSGLASSVDCWAWR